MKKLQSLYEYNQKATQSHFDYGKNEPKLNGIACPDCDNELYDSNPNMTLMSNPPKKSIHCEKCGYKGYRIA